MSSKNEIKPYKKSADYSYTLGAFPTIELLKSRPEIVRRVYVHSSLDVPEVLEQICAENDIKIVTSDHVIERLSDKENVYVVGVYDKYTEHIKSDASHLVLVNPSNMGNMGTIIRTCIGFGIKDLAIISPGVDVHNPKVVRASMGALFRIRHEYFESFEAYMETMDDRQLFFFMLSGEKQETVLECEKPKRFSLVFGNEATGLNPELEKYGKSIIIPQTDEVDSLNLTIAVGIGTFMFANHVKDECLEK